MDNEFFLDFSIMFDLDPKFFEKITKDKLPCSEEYMDKGRKSIVKKYLKTIKNFTKEENANIELLIDAMLLLSRATTIKYQTDHIEASNNELKMKMYFNGDEIIFTLNYDNAIHRHIRMHVNDGVLTLTFTNANYINGKMEELFDNIGCSYNHLDSREVHIYKNNYLVNIISDIEETDKFGNNVNSYHHYIDFVGSDSMANYYVRENTDKNGTMVVFNGQEFEFPPVLLMQEDKTASDDFTKCDYLAITENEAKVLRRIATDHFVNDEFDYCETVNKILKRHETFYVLQM